MCHLVALTPLLMRVSDNGASGEGIYSVGFEVYLSILLKTGKCQPSVGSALASLRCQQAHIPSPRPQLAISSAKVAIESVRPTGLLLAPDTHRRHTNPSAASFADHRCRYAEHKPMRRGNEIRPHPLTTTYGSIKPTHERASCLTPICFLRRYTGSSAAAPIKHM